MSTRVDTPPAVFRRRFLARERLVGTFVKTPTSHTTEILGDIGFDFVVIDEEHGPFDRITTDQALLGARAAGIAGIVRVPEPSAARLLAVLDDGAAGVLVPHVDSAAKARDVAASCRYRGGRRGFSNTTRAGRFGGRGVWEHVDMQDQEVTVIAMIEDAEALERLDEIMAVDGIDGYFIGRGDLTVALGAPAMDAPAIMIAVGQIVAAARKVGKSILMMAANAAEASGFEALGADSFIIGSDQGLMRQAGAKVVADFRALPAKSA